MSEEPWMTTNPAARMRLGRTASGRQPLSSTRGKGDEPARTPTPWDDEQVQLARDLAALIAAGLIAARSDGHEIRYAVADGEEVTA
jgi:GAF domain-containing protein